MANPVANPPAAQSDSIPPSKSAWQLTPIQRAMVLGGLESRNSGVYIQQLVWRSPASINTDTATSAWRHVAGVFDALRLEIVWSDAATPLQRVHSAVSPLVQDIKGPLDAYLAEDRHRGFHLESAPLWRVGIVRATGAPDTLVWTFHHVLLDGRSTSIVFNAWRAAYFELVAGRVPLEPTQRRSFADFLQWRSEAVTYWRYRLADLPPPPTLPQMVLHRGETAAEPPIEIEGALTVNETVSVHAAAKRLSVTPNNIIQGALLLVLMRWNDTAEACIGVIRAGRHWGAGGQPGAEAGMFIHGIPFRAGVSSSDAAGPWLRGLREQQLAGRVGEYSVPAESAQRPPSPKTRPSTRSC
jgi:Condensation domain